VLSYSLIYKTNITFAKAENGTIGPLQHEASFYSNISLACAYARPLAYDSIDLNPIDDIPRFSADSTCGIELNTSIVD
jgi:hypothetical protein